MTSPRTGGRSALVTGASRGIGNAVAHRLASRGFKLTVSSRRQADLEPLAENLRRVGAPQVIARAAEMADAEALAELVEAHASAFGAMNVLVLNAGVGATGRLAEVEPHHVRRMIDVNLVGAITILQAAVPLLRTGAATDPGRGARVVGLSSITGDYGEEGLAVYGATKAALSSLLTTFGREEAVNGICATSIAPGYVETDMSAWVTGTVPAESMIRDEDVASVVEMLTDLSAEAVIDHLPITRRLGSPYGA